MKNTVTKKSHSHVILKIWNMYIPREPAITIFITLEDLGKFDTLILILWYLYSKKSTAPWIKLGFKLSISVAVFYKFSTVEVNSLTI